MTGESNRGRTEKAIAARRTWQDDKKRATRLRIREAAMGLFAAEGYDHVTVEQIAREAEITPITFFRHFGTKEAVVLSLPIGDTLAAEIEELVARHSEGSLLEISVNVIGALADRTSQEQLDLFATRLRVVAATPDLVAKLWTTYKTRWAKTILRFLEPLLPSEYDEFRRRAAAQIIMDLILGTALWWATTTTDEHPSARRFRQLLAESAGVVAASVVPIRRSGNEA
jgi:AcrR family transcriptional regulator